MKHQSTYPAAAILLLLGLLLGLIMASCGEIEEEKATNLFAISGKVINSSDGVGLANIPVRLTDSDLTANTVNTADALSGNIGGFSFSGLQEGRFTLDADPEGITDFTYEPGSYILISGSDLTDVNFTATKK